jgi:hypothetical protein
VRLAALGDQEIHYRILEVGSKTVSTEVSVYERGKLLGLPAVREDARDANPLAGRNRAAGASRAARAAQVEAAGQSWDTIVYEDRWTDEEIHYVRRTWASEQVPVFGIIRMELRGDNRLEARLELAAFGR